MVVPTKETPSGPPRDARLAGLVGGGLAWFGWALVMTTVLVQWMVLALTIGTPLAGLFGGQGVADAATRELKGAEGSPLVVMAEWAAVPGLLLILVGVAASVVLLRQWGTGRALAVTSLAWVTAAVVVAIPYLAIALAYTYAGFGKRFFGQLLSPHVTIDNDPSDTVTAILQPVAVMVIPALVATVLVSLVSWPWVASRLAPARRPDRPGEWDHHLHPSIGRDLSDETHR